MKRHIHYIFLFLFLINLLSAQNLHAEIKTRADIPGFVGNNNIGNDFWFTVPTCYTTEPDNKSNKITVYISSHTNALVTLSIPNKADQTINIIANTVASFELSPQDAFPVRYSEPEIPLDIVKKALHISSNALINVYVLVRFAGTSDGFTVYPSAMLGTKYIVSSYGDASSSYAGIDRLSSMTGIVAVHDNTKIKFTLGGNATTKVDNMNPGDFIEKEIQKGEVFYVLASQQGKDLSGSIIEADKPISVVSGNQSTNIPLDNKMRDYIANMETPVETWGLHYHVPILQDRKYSPVIRIFAKEANTKVSINGSFHATIATAGGKIGEGYLETRINSGKNAQVAVVSADKPISVVLYNTGSYEDAAKGGPFQMSLTPVEQYQKEIRFITPGLPSGQHYKTNRLSLIIEDNTGEEWKSVSFARAQTGDLAWSDLEQIFPSTTPISFSYAVNGKKYSLLQLELKNEGVYSIKNTTALAAYSYGNSDTEAYGFPASMSLNHLFTGDVLAPVPSWSWDSKLCGNVNGLVTDKPDVGCSYLASVTNFSDELVNYVPQSDNIYDKTKSISWKLLSKQQDKYSKAALLFRDRAGNDTLIRIEYKPTNIVIEPHAIEFGLVKPNKELSKTFTVTNKSGRDVKDIDISLFFSDPKFVIADSDKTFDLDKDESKEFLLTFLGAQSGIFVDSVMIGSKCKGKNNNAIVSAMVGYPIIVADDKNFENVTKNKSVTKDLVVRNEGVVPLEIYEYSIPVFKEFVVNFPACSHSKPLIIAAKSHIVYQVTFTPTQEKPYKDAIEFISNSNTPADNIAKLNGAGVGPGLEATSYDWKRQKVGDSYSIDNEFHAIRLSNIGSQKVTISKIEMMVPDTDNVFEFDTQYFNNKQLIKSINLDPKSHIDFTVTFNPKAVGIYNCEFRYVLDEDKSRIVKTKLSGIGTQAKISASKTIIFTHANLNDIGTKKITIRNLSSSDWEYADDLIISSIAPQVYGEIGVSKHNTHGSEGFRFDHSALKFPVVIKPGKTFSFDMEHKAIKASSEAKLDITSDAHNTNKFTTTLLGQLDKEEIIINVPQQATVESLVKQHGFYSVIIKNKSTFDVDFNPITMTPSHSEFSLKNENSGFTIKSGKEHSFQIKYSPEDMQQKSTQVTISAKNGSQFTKSFGLLGIPQHMQRRLKITPINEKVHIGKSFSKKIHLQAGANISYLNISTIQLHVLFDDTYLLPVLDKIQASNGYGIESTPSITDDGKLTIQLKKIGGVINKESELVEVFFDCYMPSSSSTDFSISAIANTKLDNAITFILTDNDIAKVTLAPVCANDLYKFKTTGSNYAIESISPMPVRGGKVDLKFSIGLNGNTEILLFDHVGTKKQTVLSKPLESGSYHLVVPIVDLPSGVYFLELRSGHWRGVKKIIISK